MSLESIVSHIIAEADSQKESIIQQARKDEQRIIQEAKKEAERIYQEIIAKERALGEMQKKRLLVQARLESKKKLLQTKQGAIDAVFEKLKHILPKDKFKKEQILQDKVQSAAQDLDFYLNKIRPDFETDIAKILFA